MQKTKVLFIIIFMLLSSTALQARLEILNIQNGGDIADEINLPPANAGVPGGDLFPNHDPDYAIINLIDNSYDLVDGFPNGYYFKYPSFNNTGTKIVVSATDGTTNPTYGFKVYEIWLMDYDPVTQTVSNFQQITSNGNLNDPAGEVVYNNQCSFSRSDPDLFMYLEVHLTTANVVMSYDISAAAFDTLYDPAVDANGYDATNPGFYADYSNQIIVGSGYNSGNDRILLFDGTYPSVQVSSNDKNLDPSCNYDGTRVTYYSTQATYSEGSIYSDYLSSTWVENPNGFGDPSSVTVPGYWAFYSGRPTNMILALRSASHWTADGLGLYSASGSIVKDLLGDGGADFIWCYANHNWIGPSNEILFRAEEYLHTGYGNNIFIAVGKPSEVWVDYNWTGPLDCGGHAWGYDAFDNIKDAVAGLADGGTAHVAAGTYREQIKIDGLSMSLLGAGAGSSIIEAVDLGERATYSITQWSASTRTIDACVGVYDAGEVTISGFTIDGRDLGPNDFYGIHYFDTDGSINDCQITNITDSAHPGYSRIVSLCATHSASGSFSLDIENVSVPNFQKGGIVIMGPESECSLSDNTVLGSINPSLAPNGIQVSYGCSGTLTDNTVIGVGYPGEDWAGTCVLLMETDDITVTGGTVSGCEVGIGHSQWNWIYTPSSTPTVLIDGITMDNNQWAVSTHLGDDGVALNLEVTNCDINNCAYSGVDLWGSDVDPWGGSYYGGWINGTLNADIHDNLITLAVDAVSEYIELTTGNTANVTAVKNNYASYASHGVFNNFTNMIDATQCYWGTTAGPLTTTENNNLPIKKAVSIPVGPLDNELQPMQVVRDNTDENLVLQGVTANVDYSPWWGANYVWDDHTSPWTWYLDDSNSSTIQEGVDYAAAGDEVHVTPATYYEQVTVAKALDLLADDGAILDGTGVGTGGAILVKSGDVTIDNFEIRNYLNSNQGIIVGYESTPPGNLQNVHITNNLIHDITHATHGFGIYVGYESEGFGNGTISEHLDYTGLLVSGNEVYNVDNAALVVQSIKTGGDPDVLEISGNNFHDAGASGIWIDCARNLYIEDNLLNGNSNGIFFSAIPDGWYVEDGAYGPKDIDITGCTMQDNDYDGIVVYAGWTSTINVFNHNLFSGNASYAVQNYLTNALNAEENYWGTINCPSIESQLDGNVDFDPYCNSTFTSCDITCNITNVWVDDDWTGNSDGADLGGGKIYNYNAFDNIPDALAAVSSGGEIFIYDGDYIINEAEVTKSMTIIGETETGVVIAPEAADVWGFLYYAGNVTFKKLTIDGDANISLPSGRHFLAGIAPGDGVNADNIAVDSVTVKNVYTYGISVGNSSMPEATGLSVTNCTVQNSDTYGIQTKRGQAQVLNNVVDSVDTYAISNHYSHAVIQGNAVSNTGFVAIVTWTNTDDPVNEFGSMNATGNTVTNTFYGIVAVGDGVINDNVVDGSYIGIWSASNLWSTGLTNDVTMQGNTVTADTDWSIGFNMCNITDGSQVGGPDPEDGNLIYIPTGSVASNSDGKTTAAPNLPSDIEEPAELTMDMIKSKMVPVPKRDDVPQEKGEGGIGIYVWWTRPDNNLAIQNNQIYCDGTNAGMWFYHNDATAAPVVMDNEIRCTNSSMSDTGTGVGIFVFDDGYFTGESGGGDSYVDLTNNLITGFVDGIFAYKSATYSVGVTATGNVISENERGIYCNNQGNQFYGNYLICNEATALDDGSTNSWDDGVSLGNFWDDFVTNAGYPTTYNVPGLAGSIDNYPWSMSPAVVWVDDDWAGTACGDSVNGYLFGYNAFAKIQNGVKAVAGGGTVNVAEGTYREQVKVERKSATLTGAGIGSSIIEAVDLTDRSTYEITQWSGDARTVDACVGVVDAYNVDISGFTIDGRSLGPNNFYGIHYFDTDGSVTNCQIINITDTTHPSYSRVVSLVATHGLAGSFEIDISNVEVSAFQKGGIVLMGPNGVCQLDSNSVSGLVNPSLAPNGIQVSYGCSGSLTGNIVAGVGYPGEDWAGTCILLMETDDMTVTGGSVTGCEIGIGLSQWNWIYTPSATPSVIVDGVVLDENQWAISTHLGSENVSLDLEVKNCNIDNSEYSGIDIWGSDVDPWGGGYYSGWTNGSLTANVHDNHINNCGDAVVEYVELTDGNAVTCTSIRNDYSGYGDYGVYNNFTNMVDATQCFWGSTDGPLVTGGNRAEQKRLLAVPVSPKDELRATYTSRKLSSDNLLLQGVTANVDYSPWWGADYVDDDHSGIWTWYLDNTNSSSFMEAIGYTESGDSIFVLPGTFAGAGNRDIDLGGKELVIKATETAHNTIIDCELAGRAFHFHNGETNATVISGFTMTNGTSNFDGGAIYCENESSPRIDHCVLIGNVVDRYGGGAAFDGFSDACMINCTVSKNTANAPLNSGGGIFCFDSSPEIKNSIIFDNYGAGQNQIFNHTTNGTAPLVSYCDVEGGWPGETNVDIDPLLRNTDLNDPDFHLMTTACGDAFDSPCIDIGHPNISDAVLDCGHGLGTTDSDLGAYGGGIQIIGLEYLPGDANMTTGIWPPQVIGGDVTYLVGYFRSINDACLLSGFYCSADANGDCQVIGSDVTKLVNYFRGLTMIEFCPMHTPMWFSTDDVPVDPPTGWPNCAPVLNTITRKADSSTD